MRSDSSDDSDSSTDEQLDMVWRDHTRAVGGGARRERAPQEVSEDSSDEGSADVLEQAHMALHGATAGARGRRVRLACPPYTVFTGELCP